MIFPFAVKVQIHQLPTLPTSSFRTSSPTSGGPLALSGSLLSCYGLEHFLLPTSHSNAIFLGNSAFDVVIAYLYGPINVVIYIRPPPDFLSKIPPEDIQGYFLASKSRNLSMA
jgi:hypothetical protein